MTKRSYGLFVFDSTHAAIAAQRLLNEVGAAMMPTLRAISASCGMSLRVANEQIERAKQLMADSAIDPALYKLYSVEQDDDGTRCTLLEK